MARFQTRPGSRTENHGDGRLKRVVWISLVSRVIDCLKLIVIDTFFNYTILHFCENIYMLKN